MRWVKFAGCPGVVHDCRSGINVREVGEIEWSHLDASGIEIVGPSGGFKSLTGKGVGSDGWDVYDVAFENGSIEWHVKPLSAEGKVEGRRFEVLSEASAP